MAFSVAAVSSRVSPLFTDEVETDMLMTSAPSRLPASSKLVRVGILEEQVDQRLPAQHVALHLAGSVEQDVALRQIEQVPDFRRVQAFDRQEVFLPVGHAPC